MARPKKLTLDFFIHSASARHDRRIKSLRRRENNDGYATYYILLEMSCTEKDMKLQLTNEIIVEDVADECGLRDVSHLYRIIETCVSVGLFNSQLWKSENIIFSDDLYNSYLDRLEDRKAAAERKQRFSEAKNLQKKINEVTQENPVVTQENPVVTQENPVVTQESTPEDQNYRTTELHSLQNAQQEKNEKQVILLETNTSPEQKQNLQSLQTTQETPPPPTPAAPLLPIPPENIGITPPLKFIDPYQRAMEVRARKPEVEKMIKDVEFLKFLIPMMKRWGVYKDSCDASDARKWIRVAIEPSNDKCDSRWDESRDRYQDFLAQQAQQQTRSQQPQQTQPQEKLQRLPVPDFVLERVKRNKCIA